MRHLHGRAVTISIPFIMNLASKLTLTFANFTTFLRGDMANSKSSIQYSFNLIFPLSVLSDSADEREEKENGGTSLSGELLAYNS